MNEKQQDYSYKGAGKWASGITAFAAAVATFQIIPPAVAALWFKVTSKEKFSTNFSTFLTSKQNWGKFALAAGGLFGLAAAFGAYMKADEAKKDHDQLLADNIGMRSQLNQTSQILRHVAAQVEKGDLPDSQLAVDNSAPPSHVAKLEAERAAVELAEKSPTIH